MGLRHTYFPQEPSAPAPLAAVCERRVRFEEIDGLGMVWHGRYPSYFEDGRLSFGDTYGLSYQSFRTNNTVAPIVQMHLDYRRALHFDQMVRIETKLHWSEAARLNFSYTISTHDGHHAATGYTVQLLTDPDGTMLLVVPEWLEEFREKWRTGRLAS